MKTDDEVFEITISSSSGATTSGIWASQEPFGTFDAGDLVVEAAVAAVHCEIFDDRVNDLDLARPACLQ